MARFEHLPLYKQTYALFLEFSILVPDLPKKYKYIIGVKILDNLNDSLLKIIQINSKKDKMVLFEELILLFENIKIQCRLLKDLNLISSNKYFEFSDKIIQLLKQSEGWGKNVN